MTLGGADRDPWAAPRWLRLEGLLAAALRVTWQGKPPVVAAHGDDAGDLLNHLCSALSTSNAFALAWQALGLALVEPELRSELARTGLLATLDEPDVGQGRIDADLLDKLDVVLAVAPSVSAAFEQRLRWGALYDLRSMLDSAVILPPVSAAALPQWWSKSTEGLVARAAEHLALQLDAHGMTNLATLLRAPASPAFAFLAAYMAQHVRRLADSAREPPHDEPSLVDRWVTELYVAARVVGRFRSDIAARATDDEEAITALPPPVFGPLPPTFPPPRRRSLPPPSYAPSPESSDPPTVPRKARRGAPAWSPRGNAVGWITPIRASIAGVIAILMLTISWNRLRAVKSIEVSSTAPPPATQVAPPVDLPEPAPPLTDDPGAEQEPCARAVALAKEGDFVEANHAFAGCSTERFETGAEMALQAQKAVEEYLMKGDCRAAHAAIDAIGDVGVTLGPADEQKLVNCGQHPSPPATSKERAPDLP